MQNLTTIKETIESNESLDEYIKKNNKKQQAKLNDVIEDFILVMNMIFTLVAIVTEINGEKTISDLFYDFTSAGVIIIVIVSVIIKRCLIIKRKFQKSKPRKTNSSKKTKSNKKVKSNKKSRNNKTNSSKKSKSNKSNNKSNKSNKK